MVGAATATLREPKHVRTRGTDSKLVRRTQTTRRNGMNTVFLPLLNILLNFIKIPLSTHTEWLNDKIQQRISVAVFILDSVREMTPAEV